VRFLADESCDFAVVRALRAVRHDVVAIAEISPRATDEVVMEHAIRDVLILEWHMGHLSTLRNGRGLWNGGN